MYFPKMIAIPRRYGNSKEDSYDILNTAFQKVFKNIDKFKNTGSLEGWISKIVFNTTMDYCRKNLRYKKNLSLDLCPNVEITMNDALHNLQFEDIYKLIQELPENERTIFSLFVIDGYKHREISDLLNIATGTSKWYLANARKILQSSLKRIGYER